MLPSTKRNVSASASSRISWLNPAPHALVVYASPQPSPADVQHSLPGGRYPLPGRDFHPLEHASFSWRTRDLVLALLVGRILDPVSKLAAARTLSPASASSSLGEALGLGDVDDGELYAALDWLLARQAAIEAALAKRHLQNGTLVLYDVSSSYMEGRCCPLAKRGYSRDGKKGTLQIVYGLLCAPDGCPVAIEVFDGNTGDPTTLAPQIDKLKQRFGLSHGCSRPGLRI